MRLSAFQEHKKTFLTYIDVERNLSKNTQRAYQADLEQFALFWTDIAQQEKNILMRQALERYLVSLFYKKIDKSSVARKISCFNSFQKFVRAHGVDLSLKLTRPRLDKKLPIYLSIDEITYLLDKVTPESMPTKGPIAIKQYLNYCMQPACVAQSLLTLPWVTLT